MNEILLSGKVIISYAVLNIHCAATGTESGFPGSESRYLVFGGLLTRRIDCYISTIPGLLPSLHRLWWWLKPKLKRPASKCESTIETTAITITGTTAKTVPTDVTS